MHCARSQVERNANWRFRSDELCVFVCVVLNICVRVREEETKQRSNEALRRKRESCGDGGCSVTEFLNCLSTTGNLIAFYPQVVRRICTPTLTELVSSASS